MNEESNLDRDGLDGIHGGAGRVEPAPSYPSDGTQSSSSAKIGVAALLLAAVVVGGFYFFFMSDSKTPQTQRLAQADTMPKPSPKATVLLPSQDPRAPEPSTSIRDSETAGDAAFEAEKTAALAPPNGQTLKAVDVVPKERETQASKPLMESQFEQPTILENQGRKMVGRQQPSQHTLVTESSEERPVAMKKGEKSFPEAGQGGAPVQSTEPDAATMAGSPLPSPVTVHFLWNTTDPFDWNETKLEAAHELIKRCPDGVEIVGHTCNIGTSQVNYIVALGRAQVFHQLLKQAGVPVKGVRLRSAGDTQPVADNRTREGRALNRRAVITCIEGKKSPE